MLVQSGLELVDKCAITAAFGRELSVPIMYDSEAEYVVHTNLVVLGLSSLHF